MSQQQCIKKIMFLTTNRLKTIYCQSMFISTTIHCRYDVKPNRPKLQCTALKQNSSKKDVLWFSSTIKWRLFIQASNINHQISFSWVHFTSTIHVAIFATANEIIDRYMHSIM